MPKYIYSVTQLDGTRFTEGSDLDPKEFVKQNKHLGTGLAGVYLRTSAVTWKPIYSYKFDD